MTAYQGLTFEVPLSSKKSLFQRVLINGVAPNIANVINYSYEQVFSKKFDSAQQLASAAHTFSAAMAKVMPFVGCKNVIDYYNGITPDGIKSPDLMQRYLQSFHTKTRTLLDMTLSGDMDCIGHILAFLHVKGNLGWQAYHAYDPQEQQRKIRHMVAAREMFDHMIIIDPTREYVHKDIAPQHYHAQKPDVFQTMFYPAVLK